MSIEQILGDDAALPESIVLSHNDLVSPTWSKLKRHMEARLQALRTKNDNDLDPTSTAKTRGAIKALRDLLALSQKAPVMVADDD